jgi:hypothetical protein
LRFSSRTGWDKRKRPRDRCRLESPFWQWLAKRRIRGLKEDIRPKPEMIVDWKWLKLESPLLALRTILVGISKLFAPLIWLKIHQFEAVW